MFTTILFRLIATMSEHVDAHGFRLTVADVTAAIERERLFEFLATKYAGEFLGMLDLQPHVGRAEAALHEATGSDLTARHGESLIISLSLHVLQEAARRQAEP